MDVRKIILGLMVLVFIIILFVPVKVTPENKRCSADEDCSFVKTKCCSGCEGGFDSYNKQYSDALNAEHAANCSDTECPPLYCENPYGNSYTAVPACINDVCSSKNELNCNAVCAYYEKGDKNPYSIYVSNIAITEGLSQEALIDKCEC